MDVLTSIAHSIFANLITKTIFDKSEREIDKEYKERILNEIITFNQNYYDTVIDSNVFQSFFQKQSIVEKIAGFVFKSYLIMEKDQESFLQSIIEAAVIDIELYNTQNTVPIIIDRQIMKEYFEVLIVKLKKIREEILTTRDNSVLSIMDGRISDIVDAMHVSLEKRNAPFIDIAIVTEKINEIKSMINEYKLDKGLEIIRSIQLSFPSLNKNQSEEVLFQEARISIMKRDLSRIDNLKSNIYGINPNSTNLIEIDYMISCLQNDVTLFNKTIEKFMQYGYSQKDLLQKELKFKLSIGNIKEAISEIAENSVLKPEFEDSSLCHCILGHDFLTKSAFIEASQQYDLSFKLSGNHLYKFYSSVAKAYEVVNQNKVLYPKNKVNIDANKDALSDLLSHEQLVKYLSDEIQIEFWDLAIHIAKHIDISMANGYFLKISDKFLSSPKIQATMAHILILLGETDKAKEILYKIRDNSLQGAIDLFILLSQEKDWEKIVDLYESMSDEFQNNEAIVAFHIHARVNLCGYDLVKDELIEKAKQHRHSVGLMLDFHKLTLDNNDEEKFRELFILITGNLPVLSIPDIEIFCNFFNQINRPYEVLVLAYEKFVYSEEISKVLTYVLNSKIEDDDVLDYFADSIKSAIRSGVNYKILHRHRIVCEMNDRNIEAAIISLEWYKTQFGLDEFSAANYLKCKFSEDDLSNIEEEISFIRALKKPEYFDLEANYQAKLGNTKESQKLALRALFHNISRLDYNVLSNYIVNSLIVANLDVSTINPDRIKENTVVTLKSGDHLRKIALHDDVQLPFRNGDILFECENYSVSDPLSLSLILQGKLNNQVTVDEVIYDVIEISDIFAYFNHVCQRKLDEFPSNDALIKFSGKNPEELKNKMIEFMKISKNELEEELKLYNFGNKFGLPLSTLVKKDIEKYPNVIQFLFESNDQHFYAGEMNIKNNCNYLLSLSSIMLLNQFELLEKLNNVIDKCFINEDLYKHLLRVALKITKKSPNEIGKLYLTNEDKLHLGEYSEEYVNGIKNFWLKITRFLSNPKLEKIKSNIPFSSDDQDLLNVCIKEDLLTINISFDKDLVLVCDDLFIRRVQFIKYPQSSCTNFIGLLVSENLINFNEYFDILQKLLRSRYLYPINVEMMLRAVDWIKESSDKETRLNSINELKGVFAQLLDKISGPHYFEMYKTFRDEALERKIDPVLLYELVREPFGLKTLDEIVSEKFGI